MWLLSTDRAELHYFHDPESVPGGYAILSHVWEGQEQTFKETEALRKKCAKRKLWWHKTPRDLASPKIRASCIIAARHGYKWIWNDTCCINKKSSAELSEAINSMFRYYSLAKVCYAYLSDVPHAPRPALKETNSPFWKSKWHKRGWTLQELIAPAFLVFLSDDWNILGTKMELAELLQDITRVPIEVLRLTRAVHDFSVACRMSWAAYRVTTRAEDMAYCLMGIFSITMSTLYGEGDRAFLRLQEEIMKQSLDTSLFVWEDPDSIMVERECFPRTTCDHSLPLSFLLAQSPRFFLRSTIISFRPTLSSEVQQILKISPGPTDEVDSLLTTPTGARIHSSAGTLSFSITQYGIRTRIPVIDGPDFSGAMLGCFDEVKKQMIGLILTPCSSPPDPTRMLYHAGWHGSSMRTVLLDDVLLNDHLIDQAVSPEWRDIHIIDRPPPTTPARILSTRSDYMPSPPFRFSIQELNMSLKGYGRLVEISQRPFDWTGSPPAVLEFQHDHILVKIRIVFGRCFSPGHRRDYSFNTSTLQSTGHHWASVLFDATDSDMPLPPHNCSRDHITGWHNQSRLFTRRLFWGKASLTLSFLRDLLSPEQTLVPHIKYDLEFRY